MKVKKFFDYLYESFKIFEIGDQVICNGVQDSIHFKGEVGTIIRNLSNSTYGVKFDTRFSNYLHDCGGLDKTRCSYNIRKDLLTLKEGQNKNIIILMEQDLIGLLKKIGEDSKIVKMFLDLNNRNIDSENFKKDYVNYLNIENDGTISFLKQRYSSEFDVWNTKRRDSMKANRVLKLILKDEYFDNNIKPIDIEIFSNRLSAIFKPMEILELRGDDMLRAFNYTREMNMKLFSNSCANFHQNEWGGGHSEPKKEWYDIYTKNPKNMAVVVSIKNGRITGRKTIQQGPISTGKDKDKIFTYVGNYYGEGGYDSKDELSIDKYINKKYPLNSQKSEDHPIIKIENTKFPHYPPFDGMMVNTETDEMSMYPPRGGNWKSCYKAYFPKYEK